jgi:hypothetical protein
LTSPPLAAVYVKVSVVAEPPVTEEGDTVSVPDPSCEAFTVTLGGEERLVRVPALEDSSSVAKLAAPGLAGGVAPVAPPPVP